MKSFKDSSLDYQCGNNCGLSIFNAKEDLGKVCPRCGGLLIRLFFDEEDEKRNTSKEII